MPLVNSGGSIINKSSFPATTVPVPAGDVVKEVTANVYVTFKQEGEKNPLGTGRKLLFRQGQHVLQSQIDKVYATATIASCSPATGAAAGGTAVTLTGTNLDGVSAVTFGGTAATAVTVVSPTSVTCTTPAHAAGAVNIVATDDSGTVTKVNGFTYS